MNDTSEEDALATPTKLRSSVACRKAVMNVFRAHADAAGIAQVTDDQLVAETGFCKRSVQYALTELRALHEFEVVAYVEQRLKRVVRITTHAG